MKVPFLRKAKIERAAEDLLFGYGRKFGPITEAPVPVEEILESHLELSLDFADLPARLGNFSISPGRLLRSAFSA